MFGLRVALGAGSRVEARLERKPLVELSPAPLMAPAGLTLARDQAVQWAGVRVFGEMPSRTTRTSGPCVYNEILWAR